MKAYSWRRHYVATVTEAFIAAPPYRTRRLTVERRSGRGGIPWDVLWRVKNDVLGPDVWAVEVHPPEHALVYEYEMRHLWEVPSEMLQDGRYPFDLRRL